MRNLPIGLLRTAVAIADTRSMLRASEVVHLSPSAISMQVKRLEELAATALFLRGTREIGLTPSGEILVEHARQILSINDRLIGLFADVDETPLRIGLIEDIAHTALSRVLADLGPFAPGTSLHVRIAGTAALKAMLASGALDVIVCIEPADDPDVVATLNMQWYGDPALTGRPSLPLAVLEQPCVFRTAAIEALTAAGRPFHLMLESPSMAAIATALDADLAVTCRSALPGLPQNRVIHALPDLPRFSVAVHGGADDRPAANAVRIALTSGMRHTTPR